MKLIILVLLIGLQLCDGIKHQQYFDINSCFLRDPTTIGDLAESKEPPVFNLKLSKPYYDAAEINPFTVEIVKNSHLPINHLSEPVQLESFMIQAIQTEDDKIVGKWVLPSTRQDVTTLDCFGEKNTIIKYGQEEIERLEFEWRIDDYDQFENNTSIYFIATIVGSDQSYWLNIKSESINLIKSNNDEVISHVDKFESKEIDDELIGQQFSNKTRYRSKRDVTKHFEASTFQCGSRKSCYVSLKTCDTDPKTCNFVLSWDYDGEFVNYELTGLSYAWIGVVFTEDQTLGDDNLVVCSRDTNEKLSIDHYYRKKDDSKLIKLEPEDYLRKKFISFNQAGYIYCRFSRAKTTENSYVTDLAKPHYVYIERGAPGEAITDKLNQRFQPSDTRIDFANNVYAPVSARSWLVKIHAILGIIAWIFLGSIGILLARYYKPLWPNHVLYSFRVWFSFHRSIMVFVTLLTILSFLFALIELDWKWSADGHNFVHAILGLIVIICACINPILGFFRPTPNSKFRCIFFWLHWLIGAIAYCLAVPTIFIGMDLSKSDLPNWCAWLLFAWVIFHIIVEIILEVHYCCTFSDLQGNYNEKNSDYDRINKVPVKKKNPPGYRWKPTLLFVYAIVTAVVVSALIIAIFLLDS